MRKYRSENWKYISLPEPNTLIICRGNSWKQRNATIDSTVAVPSASR